MLARTGIRAGIKATSSRVTVGALHTTQPLPPPTSLPPLLPPHTATPKPTTTPEAISLLAISSSPSQRYITARLHSRTYLLHPTDILTLPNLPERPEVGTVLNLTRILSVGSREHEIAAPKPDAAEGRQVQGIAREGLGKDVVRCALTVLEHTKSPLTRTLLKKRRKGYERTIENKQGWTRFRVGDIFVWSE